MADEPRDRLSLLRMEAGVGPPAWSSVLAEISAPARS